MERKSPDSLVMLIDTKNQLSALNLQTFKRQGQSSEGRYYYPVYEVMVSVNGSSK